MNSDVEQLSAKTERQIDRREQTGQTPPDHGDRRWRGRSGGRDRSGSDRRGHHEKRPEEQYRCNNDQEFCDWLCGQLHGKRARPLGRRRPPLPLPSFQPSANLGANCQYPPSAEKRHQAGQAAADRQDPNHPATVSASMVTNQGNIGLLLANNESPCTVNSFASLTGQKLLQRHQMPPADHLRRTWAYCNVVIQRATAPVVPATNSPTSIPPTSTRRMTPNCRSRPLSARHAGHGQRRTPSRTAASSSWSTRTRSCRPSTPSSARFRPTGWPPWTRSPRPASPAAAKTGRLLSKSQSSRCYSTKRWPRRQTSPGRRQRRLRRCAPR